LAALMIGVAARQGASPTAIAQAELAMGAQAVVPSVFAPDDGAFNGKVAAALKDWKEA
jgi:hypothetical protein